MFRGVHSVALDVKGRVMMPAKHRDSIRESSEGRMVVTVDTEERCLLLYPLPDWNLIQAKIEALPSFNPAARRIQRLLIGHAADVELDASGRFLIPPPLRDYANLDKKIVLIGQGKKFEVWNEEQWELKREEWLAIARSENGDMPDELKSLSL
ncbi:MAG: division/cell wall cluster transcriptional repressor MraZ [Pseudomonadota bacterium]